MADIDAVSADGTRIAVHDLGGTGAPLVFVHGAGLHGHVFVPLATALRDDFHCFAVDLRGHGASGVSTPLDFEWIRLAEDVAAAVDAIGASAPFAVVHSAGGNATLRAEAHSPGTFSAIYCYEPVMHTPEIPLDITETHPIVEQALRRKTWFSSREEAFERYRARPPFDTVTDEALWAYIDFGFHAADDGGIEIACKPEYEVAVYLAGMRSDLYDVADRIRCPVAVAVGITPTNALGPVLARACAERIDGAELVGFEGLGHLGPMEDPPRVAASIIDTFVTARA